ncbi:UNVERIFIED_CONTAM: hypothetical protein Sradi_1364300 [Sesamum radiatum]|uniref:C2 domain-containing protein n=1 Tax=Sesamum radiatum TaxID=300843 RepID=A0AAW2USN0_SESRA
MDSFGKTTRFVYNPNPQPDDAFSGILEIHVHHARNIHNICIYDNQDVYAKFSLTYNPDEILSTRIINGGGKNPDFNEDLIMKINQVDAVLKCEIWMLSRAKNYMDDQLLGFALVPISSVSVADSAATPELLLDKQIPDEYSRIEFPDMNIVNQNQQMVSEYFAKNGTLLRPWPEKPDGSFLHLGAAPDVPVEDYEMVGNSSDEYRADSVSPDGSIQNSGFLSSTMTSLSDDRNSADSMEKKSRFFTDFSTSPDNNASSVIAETPTSKKKNESSEEKEPNFSGKEEESKQELSKNPVSLVRNIKLEAEESAMQQQIVDMYMRSMQQFTESLAKMKLPMDLDKPHGDDQGDVIQNSDKKMEIEKKKKDNSRVFYGSRAFF